MPGYHTVPSLLQEDEDENIQFGRSDKAETASLLHAKRYNTTPVPSYSYLSCRWFCSSPARLCSFVFLFFLVTTQALLAGFSWMPTNKDTVVVVRTSLNGHRLCRAAPSNNASLPIYQPGSQSKIQSCSPITMEVYNTVAAGLLILVSLMWYARKWSVQEKMADLGALSPCNTWKTCLFGTFVLPIFLFTVLAWAVMGWILAVHTGAISYGTRYGAKDDTHIYSIGENPFARGAPYNGTAYARVVGLFEAIVLSIASLFLWIGLLGSCCGCTKDYFCANRCGDIENTDCTYASCGVSLC